MHHKTGGIKEFSMFSPTNKKLDSNIFVSHSISILKKENKQDLWYVKLITFDGLSMSHAAYRELVGQEYLRLMIPGQPKTRILLNKKERKIYIASKEIQNCRSVDESIYDLIKQGKCIGFGILIIAALFLNEADLKFNNLVLSKHHENKKARLLKIDGDWCFANLKDPICFENDSISLTKESIQSLPILSTKSSFNWLNYIQNNKINNDVTSLLEEIKNMPTFQIEINQGALFTLIIPDNLLTAFVNHYVPDEEYANVITQFLLKRKIEMYESLDYKKFHEFLLSKECELYLTETMIYLNSFYLTGKIKFIDLLPNAIELIQIEINDIKIRVKNDRTQDERVDNKEIKGRDYSKNERVAKKRKLNENEIETKGEDFSQNQQILINSSLQNENSQNTSQEVWKFSESELDNIWESFSQQNTDIENNTELHHSDLKLFEMKFNPLY